MISPKSYLSLSSANDKPSELSETHNDAKLFSKTKQPAYKVVRNSASYFKCKRCSTAGNRLEWMLQIDSPTQLLNHMTRGCWLCQIYTLSTSSSLETGMDILSCTCKFKSNCTLSACSLYLLPFNFIVSIGLYVIKVQVGNDQEKAQSERNSHSKNRGGKKNKLTIRYLYLENIDRKPSQQLFPNRRPLSYPNLTKTMKTHIRFKQHKIIDSKT